MNKIKTLLNNYSSSLSPAQEDKTRVYAKVFGEFPEERPLSFNYQIMNRKLILNYTGMFVMIVIIIGAPLIYNQNNRPSYSGNNSPLTLSQPTSEYEGDALDSYDSSKLIDQLEETKDFLYRTQNNVAGQPVAGTEDTETASGERVTQRGGEFTLETRYTKEVFDRLTQIVNESGGYILGSSYTGNSGSGSSLVMRVPTDKFNEIVDKIRSIPGMQITAESVKATDRQSEMTELTSAKTALEQQKTELEAKIAAEQSIGTKTNLEAQLIALNASIERSQTRIEALEKQVEFSSINVTVKYKDFTFQLNAGFQGVIDTAAFMFGFWTQILLIVSPLIGIVAGVKYWRARRQS